MVRRIFLSRVFSSAGIGSSRADCKSVYGILRYPYGSVPRAVASAAQPEARSLPLAVLIQPAFPYTQLQTALVDQERMVDWKSDF